MPIPLLELPTGSVGTIAAVHVGLDHGRRMASLGLRPGVAVRIIRTSPFQGPLHIRAGHTDLILRRSDASRIDVNL